MCIPVQPRNHKSENENSLAGLPLKGLVKDIVAIILPGQLAVDFFQVVFGQFEQPIPNLFLVLLEAVQAHHNHNMFETF